MQSDKRSVLPTSRKNMPGCGRCRRSWAPRRCKFGSVRALYIEGKKITGSEGMNRLAPGLKRIPCLQWQEKGDAVVSFCACWGFPWRDLCWLWQEGWVAEGGTALCLFCRSGSEIPHAGKPKATIKATRLAWVNFYLNYKWIQTNPSPFNATFCCGGESNLPLGIWSND